jgi:TetR/AcrR family transcriptional regulator, mexCD-oprJ operon repressor
VTRETTDHRHLTAQRNVDSILDATESLLERGAPASTTAVAAEAGVSRVTVYSHFPTQEALFEEVARRAISRFAQTLDQVDLEHGDPVTTLEQLIGHAWAGITRNHVIAQAATQHLSPVALERAHGLLHEPLRLFIERGQREGAFRSDLPADWLMMSYFALMHAYRDGVIRGRFGEDDASRILTATLLGLFTPSGGDRS